MNASHTHAPRWRAFWLWLILVLVAVLLGLGLWLASRPQAVQLQGTVEAEQINVSTKALARVEKTLAAPGQRVKAGQLLAQLSSPELDGATRQAGNALEVAQAEQKAADDLARPEDIEAAHAAWQAAQAQAELAKVSEQRAEALFAEGVIAAQRRDEARAARVSSARMAEAARAQWQKLRAGARPEVRAVAKARVDSAESLLHTARALDAETRLMAPADGEVASRLAQDGEIVGPLTPVFQIVAIDHPWVRLAVREDQYKGLQMGRELRGDVPALGLQGAPFKVSFISPMGEFATWRATQQASGFDVRSFDVRLVPVQPIEGLRPGMSVLFAWPQ